MPLGAVSWSICGARSTACPGRMVAALEGIPDRTVTDDIMMPDRVLNADDMVIPDRVLSADDAMVPDPTGRECFGADAGQDSGRECCGDLHDHDIRQRGLHQNLGVRQHGLHRDPDIRQSVAAHYALPMPFSAVQL